MDLSTALASIEFFYRRTYWDAPTAITRSTPDYTLTYSGVTWLHSINQLWLHHPEALDNRLLGRAAEFFREYGAEYSVIFAQEAPLQLARWMSTRHYIERAANPIYALHGLPHPQFVCRDLEVVPVTIDRQQELLEVLYGTFFMGPEIGRCAVRTEHFSDPSIRHYLAYIHGEVVGCATILLDNGIAGVWNVGTLRNYRKQGVASALLMHVLAEAISDGYPDSVLIASPMGRPLYEEMGYQFVGDALFYGPGE
jgi:GNAT superfamily N-acetyltransferase